MKSFTNVGVILFFFSFLEGGVKQEYPLINFTFSQLEHLYLCRCSYAVVFYQKKNKKKQNKQLEIYFQRTSGKVGKNKDTNKNHTACYMLMLNQTNLQNKNSALTCLFQLCRRDL